MTPATSGPVFRPLPPEQPPPLPLATRLCPAGALEAAARAAAAGSPRIVLSSQVRHALLSHLEGCPHERGGLLLGDVHGLDGSDHPYPFLTNVTHAVPAPEISSGPASLVMHPDVWTLARTELDQGRRVIGWYHSHPGLGAFFSGTDRRTQRAFFGEAFALGLVIDCERRVSLVFTGPEARVHSGPDGQPWDPLFDRAAPARHPSGE